MAHKIVDEPIILDMTMILQVEKYLSIVPKVETTLTNTLTGNTYASEEEMQADINDSGTAITEAEIRRDVLVIAPKLLTGADILDEDKKD